MKGITRIGTALVYDIFKNRPYNSIEDFMSKVKINKLQMLALIKAGAFDSLYSEDRTEIMKKYIDIIADKKKRITLQNMQMLIYKQMIPKELDFERYLFNFNKYIKNSKQGNYYLLDTKAMNFFTRNFDESVLEDVVINGNELSAKIKQTTWDNTYKKNMEPVRKWMKENQESILNDLNNELFNETWEKYAEGSVSKWEMDSLGFYYHEHELARIKREVYGIDNFFKLPEEPEVQYSFTTNKGTEMTVFNLSRIAGTVIDKDKNKGNVILLTTDGVVTVKVWKNQFAVWDKTISKRGADGVKHVIENSWFKKGTKLIITGVRRGDNFIPKKYKNCSHPLFEKVIEINDRGFILESATERVEEE